MRIKKILIFNLVVGVLVAAISSVCLLGYAENHMTVYRDIDYISGANYVDDKDKLDIFMPNNQKNVPVLIFFHGGALQGGDKREQGFIATRFVSEGVGVVLANYRLSPMVMHPAHILDAAAVFAFIP
jgi:acetyl esterase/lipase